MLQICLKYFIIIMCSFYLYLKLLNLPHSKTIKIQHVIYAVTISILIYLVRENFAQYSIILLSLIFTLVTYLIHKQSFNTTLLSSLISLSFSYVLYILGIFCITPIRLILVPFLDNNPTVYTFALFLIGLIQIFIVKILFNTSRLKNGMPFLKEHGNSDVGAFTAISSLIAVTLFNLSSDYSPSLLILLSFVILSGILIFFWWKSKLTENYYKAAKDREINELKSKIAELEEFNAIQAKIIHKDNKLIPAMLLSVNDTIVETYESADEAQRRRLTSIVSQLNDVAKERKGLVLFSETEAKAHYSTGVPAIDTQLKFQAANAYATQTSFDVVISDKLNIIVPDIISSQDLHTLVADLLTNAVIAVKTETKRNVMFHAHIDNDIFYIDFYDSGTPFDKEVLAKMGKERITTHGDEGGSGIGYMTTFEILDRCNGRLDIVEDLNLELYTKKVSISFPLDFED